MEGCIRSIIPFPHFEFHPKPEERISTKDLGTKGNWCKRQQVRKQNQAVVLKVWSLDPQLVSPGNMVEVQIPRPLPRPTEAKSLGERPSNLYFLKPWQDSQLENNQLVNQP